MEKRQLMIRWLPSGKALSRLAWQSGVVLAGLLGREARAEPALQLVYDAPAECPSAEALRSDVENLVAHDNVRPFTAHVTISNADGAYRSSITGADGSARTLSGSTCAEVLEGTAVVLALAISPKLGPSGHSEAGDAPTSLPPPAVERSQEAFNVIVAASARVDVGTLPHAALGFAGQVGVERGAWSLRAGGVYWLASRGSLSDQPSLGGDFAWWTGGLTACAAPARGALRLDLCLGAELGRLSAVGRGVSNPQHPDVLWGDVDAGVAASWALFSHLRLRAEVGAAATFSGRRAFILDGIARVHQPAPITGRAEFGPELLF